MPGGHIETFYTLGGEGGGGEASHVRTHALMVLSANYGNESIILVPVLLLE